MRLQIITATLCGLVLGYGANVKENIKHVEPITPKISNTKASYGIISKEIENYPKINIIK